MREFRLPCLWFWQNVRCRTFPATARIPMPLRLSAALDHLKLHAEDPGRLADFYRTVMDAETEALAPDLLACSGPERRLLIGRGAPRSLAFAGYRAASQAVLDQLARRLARAGVARLAPESPWFEPGAVALADPDGN